MTNHPPTDGEVTVHNTNCPSCGSPRDGDSRFCQQCGLGLPPAEQAPATEIQPSTHTTCPSCNEQIRRQAAFCWNCGQQVSRLPERAGPERKKPVALILGACLAVAVLYILFSPSTSKTNVTLPITTYQRNAGSIIGSATPPESNKLTNAKVEDAVGRMTSNLRVGGAVVVSGIQELPQENAARADLRFNSFQYKSDMAGTPVASNRQAPRKPEVNSPNFYDEMYKYGTQQIQLKNYSGPGVAILKHYSDGRWVLTEVHWEFNGWTGTVDIK